MKNKHPQVVEVKYVGELELPADFREWRKWKAYEKLSTAQSALLILQRKFPSFEFRLRPEVKENEDD